MTAMPILITAFETAATPIPAITLHYQSTDRARAAYRLVRHEAAVDQFGIDVQNDNSLRDRKTAEDVTFVVQFDRLRAPMARTLFDSLMLQQDSGRQALATFEPGRQFTLPIPAHELDYCTRRTAEAGFSPRAHMGHNDFDPQDPVSLPAGGGALTVRWRRGYDGQAQGAHQRHLLRELASADLSPDRLSARGMGDYLTRRLVLVFADYAAGLKALAKPSPHGFDLNADYFIEETSPAEGRASLRGPKGTKMYLDENVFRDGSARIIEMPAAWQRRAR